MIHDPSPCIRISSVTNKQAGGRVVRSAAPPTELYFSASLTIEEPAEPSIRLVRVRCRAMSRNMVIQHWQQVNCNPSTMRWHPFNEMRDDGFPHRQVFLPTPVTGPLPRRPFLSLYARKSEYGGKARSSCWSYYFVSRQRASLRAPSNRAQLACSDIFNRGSLARLGKYPPLLIIY